MSDYCPARDALRAYERRWLDRVALARSLSRLASNLTIAGALAHSFTLGSVYGYTTCPCGEIIDDEDWERIHAVHWTPGCGRRAP